ncbi:MAG: hypothetical protein ABDK92_00765, partial [Atribacterota bacterium]
MNIMEEIKKIKVNLLLEHPFFGAILAQTPIVTAELIPTAATDGDKIYINPIYFSKLSNKEKKFVVLHEVLHIALLHPVRIADRDQKLFNIAGDIVINYLLHNRFNLPLLEGVLYHP